MICKTCGKDIPDYTQHLCPGKDQNKGSYSTQPKQMEKINKCGCGGKGIIWSSEKYFAIKCKDCGGRTIDYKSREEAITAWNTAHPDYDQQISDLTAGKEQAERELQVALKALELAVSNIYGQESHIYPTCDCEYCMAYSETRYWLDCAKRDIAEAKEQ